MRVLMLTHRLPYAANRGDRVRALNILRRLAGSMDVDLVSLAHSDDEADRAADLEGIAASVSVARVRRVRAAARALGTLAVGGPLTHALLDAPAMHETICRVVARRPPDVVLAYCSGVARYALSPPLARIPLVVDMVDVDSEKWRTLGTTVRGPLGWVYAREARQMATFEARVSEVARCVMVVNDREREALLRIAPSANVQIVQNGVALENLRPRSAPTSELRVCFCGVMNYKPNQDAALWFASEVWPRVLALHPEARLSLVGSDPTAAMRRLATSDPTIEVTGAVDDVRPYLWASAVSVAPLQIARGVQNKVLEAIAAGLPCVVTTAVQQGLPREAWPACTTADEASDFAVAVARLLNRTPEDRRMLAARAPLGAFEWNERMAPVDGIVKIAARRSSEVPALRSGVA